MRELRGTLCRHRAVVFACVVAAMPLLAQAQEGDVSMPRPVTVQGVVEHVDYASGTVYLEDLHGRERTIFTSPSTTIVGANESGYEELSDIRPGAHVRVEASRVDRRLDAAVIQIQMNRW